jgi:hypothetical protein
MTRERIGLSDRERHDIRWSQSKRAYVVVINDWQQGPEGGWANSLRGPAVRSLDAAIDWLDSAPRRFGHTPLTATVYEVDAMGRVTGEVAA